MRKGLFIMTQDQRVADAIRPMDSEGVLAEALAGPKGGASFFKPDGSQSIAPLRLMQQKRVVAVDFIQKPAPLVSDIVKEVLAKYAPRALFRSVVLVDPGSGIQASYWLLERPLVHCLAAQTEFFPDGTCKRLVVDPSKAGKHPFLKIGGLREDVTLVQLGVAESLLRREVAGIRFTKVQLQLSEEERWG
ncbi:hypothetical protein ABEW34_12395 [Paenibacillus algorifonticola]|uniref:hypothetical protein n=1 Tax=Paenibacillus algorifonticola TaxID=684063 RepID=UPI003D2B69F0